MRLNLDKLPEVPAEGHPFYLLPEKRVRVPLPSGEIELAFREMGAGAPILLLHGLWCSSYSFRSLLGPLASAHRVILPELIDFAGRQALPAQDYRPERLATLIKGLLRALSLSRPLLCAHAESGLAGLLLALEDPSCLSGLAAIGSSLQLPALARLRGRAAGWTFFTERLARRGFRDPQSAAAAMLDYADPAVLSRQEIRESARAWATLPGAQLRARVLNQTLSTDYRARINQALAAAGGRPFPVPLALLYGASDRRAPPHQAEQLNRMFPGSELHLAERSSGSVQVERPEWTARIVGALALACSPS